MTVLRSMFVAATTLVLAAPLHAAMTPERERFVEQALKLYVILDKADRAAYPEKDPQGGTKTLEDLDKRLPGYEQAMRHIADADRLADRLDSGSDADLVAVKKVIIDMLTSWRTSFESESKTLALLKKIDASRADPIEIMNASWKLARQKRGLLMKLGFTTAGSLTRILDDDHPGGSLKVSPETRKRWIALIDEGFPNAALTNLFDHPSQQQINLSSLSFTEVMGSTLRPALETGSSLK